MKSLFQSVTKATLTLIAISLLGACDILDDDNDSDNSAQATAKLQVIHASPDAPAVNVYADGSLLLEDFDYAVASPRLTISAGVLNVDVQGILPDGTTPSVIGPVDLTLEQDTDYTVIAVNSVANIEPLVVTREASELSTGNFRAQVVHAAPDAPMVDVYVTTPGTDLSTEAPLGTIEFKGDLGPVDVAAGEYQIRITAAGDSDAVVFDSGTLALTSGLNLTIAAIANTGPGSAPVQLLVATADGSFVVRDANSPADLRVIHASPDAPAVDIRVNNNVVLVSNLAYAENSDFVSVTPDTYNVKVVPTGETEPAVINADLTLEQGMYYSVLAVDLLDSIDALVLTEDRRSVATEAKLQVVHASPAAGTVDVYVTGEGADISELDPAINSFEFKATSNGFISLPEGVYDVTVTPTGSKDAAIGPATIELTAGGVYTIIARDAQRMDANDSGLPLNVILLDDFNVLPK